MISVIVPVRNGSEFISSAMRTIAGQEYDDLEVVIVDDGSTDGIEAQVESLPPYVRCLRQEARGQAAARNRGIDASKGELTAFLDVDDLWSRHHLRTLLNCLETNREAGIAQGTMRQFWEEPGGGYRWTEPYRMPYLGSCLFRKIVLLQQRCFDETMAYGEDYDLMFRCWESDVIKVHSSGLSLLYRRHAGNMTRGRNEAAHLLVLKRRIERVRAGLVDPGAPRRHVFQHYIGEQSAELPSREVSECELRSA